MKAEIRPDRWNFCKG